MRVGLILKKKKNLINTATEPTKKVFKYSEAQTHTHTHTESGKNSKRQDKYEGRVTTQRHQAGL